MEKIKTNKSNVFKRKVLQVSLIFFVFASFNFIKLLTSDYYKAYRRGLIDTVNITQNSDYKFEDFRVGQELDLERVKMIYESEENLYYPVKPENDQEKLLELTKTISNYKENPEHLVNHISNLLIEERDKIKETTSFKIATLKHESFYFPNINSAIKYTQNLERYVYGTTISLKGVVDKIDKENKIVYLDLDKDFLDKDIIGKIPFKIKMNIALIVLFAMLYVRTLLDIKASKKVAIRVKE